MTGVQTCALPIFFKAVVEQDQLENGDRAYHAYCPALKGCHTWGHTHSEALSNLREAVELFVEDLMEAGEPIPADPDEVVELPSPSVAVNV